MNNKLSSFWNELPVFWKRIIVFAFGAFIGIQAWSVITTGEATGLTFLEFIGMDFLGRIFGE